MVGIFLFYLVCADEISMEDGETTNEPESNESVDQKRNGSRSLEHCFPNRCTLSVHDSRDVNPAKSMHV